MLKDLVKFVRLQGEKSCVDNLRPLCLREVDQKKSLRFKRVKKVMKKLLLPLLIVGVLILFAFYLVTRSSTTSYVNQILSGTFLHNSDGRINVLLLGIAGGQHAGSSLTDTIMVASYDLKTNKLFLFSLPRDLWLPSLKSKANAVYVIGQSQNNGLGLTKTIMGNILGIPIHYALRIDFRGFVRAIDVMDGIEVDVEKAFDDYLYPIQGKETDLCGNTEKEMDISEEEAKKLGLEPGKQTVLLTSDGNIVTDSAEEDKGIKYFSCRYEHIRFEKGKVQMRGAVALAYVRSRHGTNGEGSDFARAKRQQKMIEAIRNKVLSLEILASPQKIADLMKILGSSIDTDITAKDGLEIYRLSKKMEGTYNLVIDDSPKAGLRNGQKSLLIHPSNSNYGGAYVLISQDDDFSTIQGYVRKVLIGGLTNEATASAWPR